MKKCNMVLNGVLVVVALHGAEKAPSPFADPGLQARQATADKKKEHPARITRKQHDLVQKAAAQLAKEKKEKEPYSPSKTPSEAPKREGGRPELYSSGNWKMS